MELDIEVEDGALRLSAEQAASQPLEREFGPGWFESSLELLRGLSVDEGGEAGEGEEGEGATRGEGAQCGG